MTGDPRPGWAVRLQAERERREWSKPQMARQLYAAVGVLDVSSDKARSLARQILGWEKGEHFPQTWSAAYAAALGVTEEELFGDAEPPSASAIALANSLTARATRTAERMSSMERRNLLMFMGLGVAAPWPVAENLRAALSRTGGASDSVADWRDVVSDHASTMSVTSPAQMLPDLLSDLNEVNALLEAGHPEQKSLLEVAAALAGFTSMATYDSGYPGRAFRWWRTAQHLADRSESASIRAYVRARRGADLLYGRGQHQQALQLADEAVRIASVRPSVGLAEAYALNAAAHAETAGEPLARESLDEMTRTVDRLADQEFYAPCWPADHRVRQTRAHTYLKLGDGKAAIQAAGKASSNPFTQMLLAASMVLVGKADDGVGLAVKTLNGLDSAHDRLSIRERGREVLAALPDRASTSATAHELRALTQSVA